MDLSGTVARVEGICRRFRIDSLAPQLAACEGMLGDGGVVDVAVLGQFKAGKSSFLNGLIGGAIVPVDVLPSTAVVTRIGYGLRERVTVHGLGGEPFEIPLGRLSEFVTERGNPANEKRVAVVDVELPSLLPYEGVRFVDTPGLGSIFAHNTKVSVDWLPRVGAAREFEGGLADAMMEEMGAVSLRGEGHLAGFLFKAQASVERSVRAFVDRLAREIERALGIRFEGARFDPQVEEPAHPDVRLSPTFDTYFELLWFLIPMTVFRPLVRRHFLRRIPWEVEKNLSRVAGQWADAVGASIDVLFRAALAELDALESGV